MDCHSLSARQMECLLSVRFTAHKVCATAFEGGVERTRVSLWVCVRLGDT